MLPPRPSSRRGVLIGGLAATATAAVTPKAFAGGSGLGSRRPRPLPAGVDRSALMTWAEDTWHSMVAMTDPGTGLPADNITGDLTTRSGYTSPTNIGGLMWSAV